MNLSWKIFTAFKIPVRLHISMVIIPYFAFTRVKDPGPWDIVTSMGLVVLLFGSVLLHELGHALTPSAAWRGCTTCPVRPCGKYS